MKGEGEVESQDEAYTKRKRRKQVRIERGGYQGDSEKNANIDWRMRRKGSVQIQHERDPPSRLGVPRWADFLQIIPANNYSSS